jgi:hypothetical protein
MLIDTSIWVEHLSHNQLGLVSLLHREDVHCHPFIIGELACGSIIRRVEILQLLRRLPSVPVVENEEVARSADLAYEIGTLELALADQTGKSAARASGSRSISPRIFRSSRSFHCCWRSTTSCSSSCASSRFSLKDAIDF